MSSFFELIGVITIVFFVFVISGLCSTDDKKSKSKLDKVLRQYRDDEK